MFCVCVYARVCARTESEAPQRGGAVPAALRGFVVRMWRAAVSPSHLPNSPWISVISFLWYSIWEPPVIRSVSALKVLEVKLHSHATVLYLQFNLAPLHRRYLHHYLWSVMIFIYFLLLLYIYFLFLFCCRINTVIWILLGGVSNKIFKPSECHCLDTFINI